MFDNNVKYVSLYFELFKAAVCGLWKGGDCDMLYETEDFSRLIWRSETSEKLLKFDFLYYCLYNSSINVKVRGNSLSFASGA
jgi:hypothetical protein